MKIRINTRPKVKASTLFIIIGIIILVLFLFMFSDMLPKPKTRNISTNEMTPEQQELLIEELEQLQLEYEQNNPHHEPDSHSGS